jgi:hypothetical protein
MEKTPAQQTRKKLAQQNTKTSTTELTDELLADELLEVVGGGSRPMTEARDVSKFGS